MSPHIKYTIRRQDDGSWVILQKDKLNNKLTIHSTYEEYEDANDALTDLYHKPSQAETLKILNDLRTSLNNI